MKQGSFVPAFPFLHEHLCSERKAKSLSAFIWPDVCDVWYRAFALLETFPEEGRARLFESPAARPINLAYLAQSFIKELFGNREDEGIVLCDKIPNTVTVFVKKRILLRFNRLDSDYLVRNCDGTDLKEDYYDQRPIAHLGNATRLTAGYIFDPTRTTIAGVELSLQVGDTPIYHFPIDGSAAVIRVREPQNAPAPKSVRDPRKQAVKPR